MLDIPRSLLCISSVLTLHLCQALALNKSEMWQDIICCMSRPQATCLGRDGPCQAIALYAVLKIPALVEHALRQTLAADAVSLQFKLPPPSLPVPIAQSSDDIAGGALVVDALAITSVWVVQLLRMLCSVRQASSLTASVHAEMLEVCLACPPRSSDSHSALSDQLCMHSALWSLTMLTRSSK